MKNRQANLRLALLTAGLATATAADITWDISADPGVQGGAGAWNTSTANWTTDDGASNIAWNNAAHSADTALFSQGSGIVTVGGDIDLAGIAITSTTGTTIGGRANVGYLLNGGALRFGAQNGDIDTTAANTTLHINNNLTGTGGLTLRSTGGDTGTSPWTVLNGNNTGLTGGIAITSGLVAFTNQNAAGSNTISLQNGGGVFGPADHSGDGSGAAVTAPAELTLSNPLHITGFDNRLRVWGGRTLALTGPLTGDGSVRKVDGGTLSLTGNLSGFSGEILNAAGVTTLGAPFAGALLAQAGTVNLDSAFSGALEISGGTVNSSANFNGTLNFAGGALNIAAGTFTGGIDYESGSLNIAAGATVSGNVNALFGATSLTVAGTINGNLFVDEQITATFSGASITGNLTTGDPTFSPLVTLQQTNGPIQIGGTLTVNGNLDIVADGSVAPGQNIVTYANLVTGSVNPADHVRVAGVDLMRNGVTTIGATGISFNYTPETVTWTGAVSDLWEADADQNWDLDGSPDKFFNGDNVIFPAAAPVTTITLAGPIAVGGMSVDTDTAYTFSGSAIGGTGSFAKTGSGAATFNQTAGNAFPGGFTVSGGSISIASNQQATGTGPLVLSPGTALSAFPANATATITFGNSSVVVDQATWNLGGGSPGSVTHTYNFAGPAGSTTETDPATAIQLIDSVLNLGSTNTTTKTFNGRINWTGTNTVNRTSSGFTHSTNWNGAWYGDGTIVINKTGGATGRSMTFNGAGSTFSGILALSQTEASGGNNPVFNLNQPLPASAIDIANRWNLSNNVAGGLDGVGEIFVLNASSRLTLAQPVNNPGLILDLGEGTLALGNAPSAVGTLGAISATILSGGADSALSVTGGASSVFAGAIDLEAGNTVSVNTSGVGIGTQAIGGLTQSGGGFRVGFDATGANIASIAGSYTHTGGDLIVEIASLPATGTPYTVLTYASRTGTPPVVVTGLEGSSLTASVSYGANAITLTFSGSSANLVWSGATDGFWDTATQNWLSSGSPAAYTQFDTVTFNDSATGPTGIFLDTLITPGGVTFDNNSLAYSITGFGEISGGTPLTKNGDGVLTLGTTNTYSGGTSILGGRVRVGATNAFGSAAVSIQNAAVSADGTGAWTLANAFTLGGIATFGHESDTGSLTLTGPVSGSGNLIKTGGGTVTLSPAAANAITGSVTISGGALSVGTEQQATGTGPLVVTEGGTLNSFGLAATATLTYGNSSIAINGGTWTFGGSSGGNVTHTYDFAGDLGSASATDPASAIQVTNGTLTLNSSNTTTKAFNGRINWSGANTINRTSGNFTHSTNWNRAWYGAGTVTINKTGTATGRSMTFNGPGSTFSGSLVLDATAPEGGNNPAFNLNQPLPASSIEVRNRWNLVHNTADGFAANATVSVVHAASRLTLTQPVNRPGLSLVVGEGAIDAGTGDSTVGTLTVNGVPQIAGTYHSGNSAFITGTGNIVVLGGPSGGGYDEWLASHGLTPGSPGTGAGESYDGSGVANIVQFALGGDPIDPTDNGIHAVFRKDAANNDNLVLTIAAPAGATFTGSPSPTAAPGGITIAIQGSTSLGAWTETVEEVAVQTGSVLTAPAGYQLKSFRLVQTPALGSKGFLRVSVTQS